MLLIASAVIVSALSGIYRTALYHFAANGTVPGEFSGIDFDAAFRRRGNRGGIVRQPVEQLAPAVRSGPGDGP